MKYIYRGIIVFCILMVATTMMMDVFKTEFGKIDYFQKHGLFLLVGLSIFPRLTLLLSSIASGGLFWWAAWVFCPRILIATLATVAYFQTNPVLVVASWLIAFGGEAFEKWGLGKQRNSFVFKTYRAQPQYEAPREERRVDDANTFEAEFTKKD